MTKNGLKFGQKWQFSIPKSQLISNPGIGIWNESRDPGIGFRDCKPYNSLFHIVFNVQPLRVCCFRIPNLVNQRPPHLKFRGFPTLMASRFSKGADLISHYPLLTFNLWPTHNLSPQTIGIQKDPKSWSLSFTNSIPTNISNFSRPFHSFYKENILVQSRL